MKKFFLITIFATAKTRETQIKYNDGDKLWPRIKGVKRVSILGDSSTTGTWASDPVYTSWPGVFNTLI